MYCGCFVQHSSQVSIILLFIHLVRKVDLSMTILMSPDASVGNHDETNIDKILILFNARGCDFKTHYVWFIEAEWYIYASSVIKWRSNFLKRTKYQKSGFKGIAAINIDGCIINANIVFRLVERYVDIKMSPHLNQKQNRILSGY